MENVKYKGREVASKNDVGKVGKKPQKRVKKTKGKENLEPLFSTRHKCCKLTAQEPLKGSRTKDVRGVDGVFFKGLRTQYITRRTLNEVNEARKNEDINKIIDIGRVYFLNRKLAVPPGRPGKGVSGLDSRSSEKLSFAFGESSTDSSQDFECSLSPISPPLLRERGEDFGIAVEVSRTKKKCNADEMPVGRRKPNLERELKTFSLKYEALVGAQILFKLPENGILEDALTALRKFLKTRQDEEPEREKRLLSSQRDDLEAEDYILRRNYLAPEKQFCESFMENPLENMFIMNGWKMENANHSSHLTVFDHGDEGKSENIESQAKDFQKPVKDLRIATPPIQFYRRNMF